MARYGFLSLTTVSIAAALAASPAASALDVTVDGARRHQTIEGFGTCLIAWVDQFRSATWR